MKRDCLIIGQGICGSFLAHELEKARLSFLVIDDNKPLTASRSAAGIVNPVTGRRLVKSWLIDELLPFATRAYGEMEAKLGISSIRQTNIMDFFPNPQMRLAFTGRVEENAQYLAMPQEENAWLPWFNYELGYGEINSSLLIELNHLLPAYRERLAASACLLDEEFDWAALRVDDGIRYKGMEADRIIFCDGMAGTKNPFFSLLPFAPNKGEALIAEIPDLPRSHIFKKGLSLVPWKENLFWIGSSYEWQFDNTEVSAGFRQNAESLMRHWLRVPFRILDHIASVRPATLERRPFVGFHPRAERVGILNGMGTKGCTLGPFFAAQLCHHMVNNQLLHPEADVRRHARILQR